MHAFRFAKLLSRAPGDTAGVYTYSVQGVDGSTRTVDERTARAFPLSAAAGETRWKCRCCSSGWWSLKRARLCITCGAPSPEDEAILTELKQSERAKMAQLRPHRLHGRRIVLPPRQPRSTPRAPEAYAIDTDDMERELREMRAACSRWS